MKIEKKIGLLFVSAVILFFISTSLIAYPVVSDWYSEKVRSTVQTEYFEMIEAQENEEIRQALIDAQKYNESLCSVQTEQGADIKEYMELLNVGNTGIMGYVEIPVIDITLPIYHTVDNSVMQIGAGHMEGTSLPVGGPSTHAVISAHSGMSGSRMFSDLDRVRKGDYVFIRVLGETLAYEVTGTEVVLPSAVDKIQIVEGKDMVTLITCVPYGVNTHRLLVRAERTELSEEEIIDEEAEVEIATSTWFEKYVEGIIFGLFIAGGTLVIIIIINTINKKRRE